MVESELVDPSGSLDLGSAESRTFSCGCRAVLFDTSAVVAVNPCDDHEDRLTAIK